MSSGSRIFLFYLYMCECIPPCGKTKNDTDLKFATHTPLDPMLKRVFCFFRKNYPEGRQPRKTAVSRGFSAYRLNFLFFRKNDPKDILTCKNEYRCMGGLASCRETDHDVPTRNRISPLFIRYFYGIFYIALKCRSRAFH